ncbi:YggS family pyridoxal phosphate-dependent enzyme [Dictyobacter arantiisoli]|uniref:Pyridoxal phosphate homeostasis protein n=1 Tax=Dictyobacter arantiisoli TaxID=2014874 RepID=A0A5A5TF96_9CHLR|nr:YggS family pyridoxal phosphate-dependent enzyme [Dictyobacter arantiisoli]GCF09679.1 YggS family pyridoxal phosphate enzyme [Dictyobacter arantiisoli]
MINQPPISQEALIAENIAHVRTTIAEAARRAGRSPEEITLVAVSKTKPLEFIKIAYNLGMRDFGENRIQEALEKQAAFCPADLRWHMIGHVQTNKANKAAASFAYIHSIDSFHAAEALQRAVEKKSQATGESLRQAVFLQVNISGEASKEGMSAADAPGIVRQILSLPQLEVCGLMTVAPLVEDAEQVRPVFRALRELRDELRQQFPAVNWEHLSMGMTDDYPVAIEEGATIVRVGRAIFGERIQVKQPLAC